MSLLGNARQQARIGKQMLKDSGYKRPDDFDYTCEEKQIIITFKDAELAKRVLSTLDSSIEWGLRMSK